MTIQPPLKRVTPYGWDIPIEVDIPFGMGLKGNVAPALRTSGKAFRFSNGCDRFPWLNLIRDKGSCCPGTMVQSHVRDPEFTAAKVLEDDYTAVSRVTALAFHDQFIERHSGQQGGPGSGYKSSHLV